MGNVKSKIDATLMLDEATASSHGMEIFRIKLFTDPVFVQYQSRWSEKVVHIVMPDVGATVRGTKSESEPYGPRLSSYPAACRFAVISRPANSTPWTRSEELYSPIEQPYSA